METPYIFKRLEEKFVLSQAQYLSVYDIIKQHTLSDAFGEYLVQSLYFDTDNWDVIRKSIEKPLYKEKMRLRCYNVPSVNSTIFLELKKKYKGIVYKRRISFPLNDLQNNNARDLAAMNTSQIGRELNFYLKTNPVHEKAHIAYKRSALTDNKGLRITFDTNIRFRKDFLDYEHPEGGLAVLPEGLIIMEVKSLGGMPLWLTQAINTLNIFPTTFSKYGVGYKKYVLQKDDTDLWIS